MFYIFPYVGNVIITMDSYMFQRGRYTTNQAKSENSLDENDEHGEVRS